MKKSIFFIGIIFLLLLGTTVALAAAEGIVVKATVENDRIYIGDKTKVGYSVIFSDPAYPEFCITLDNYNFANNSFFVLNKDCISVKYSSDNSKIAVVDDNGTVTGISAGTATITQEITLNIQYLRVNEDLYSENYKGLGAGCQLMDLFSKTSLYDGTYTRKATIAVVPDDRLYLCQPGKEPTPVKISMNAASLEVDRLSAGDSMNVDFSVTMTELNDPAVKYTFNKYDLILGTALDFENLTVEYSSDNESVATVNKGGLVTGISEGWANITINLTFNPEILGQEGSNARIRKARLAVKPSDTARTVRFTRQISILVHPAPVMNNVILAQSKSRQLTAGARTDKWAISDPSIAKIDKTGRITGLKPGKTYVVYYLAKILEDEYGFLMLEIPVVGSVTVYPVMAIHPDSITVYIGTPKTINVTFDSWYYGEKAGTWSIADKAVASVDQSGNVTGLKAGTTTATFTITETGAQTDCSVVVKEPPFRIEPDPLEIYNGGTERLSVTFDSAYTGKKTGTWSVADGTIASVEDNSTAFIRINRRHTIPGTAGAKVTGLKPGTTIVTFTNTATGARQDCTVTVRPTFTIAPDPLTVYTGETGSLAVTFDAGYQGSRDGRWSVDDNTVVSIDQNGIVTGKTAGTAIASYAADPTPAASVNLSGIAKILQATAVAKPAQNNVRTVSVVVKPGTFTVTFDPNGGGPTPSRVTVKHDTVVARPVDPSLNGRRFLGWYTALDGGSVWDFANDKVTEDMTLYAHWTVMPNNKTSADKESEYTAPRIAGPDTINLLEGYDSIDQAYTFGGYPAPTYGISPTEPNTANAAFAGTTLTIPEGIDIGSYEVTLYATNSVGTTTKTVTVNVYPAITINITTEIEFFLLREDNSIIASGGAGGPYTFALASGAMPTGLVLNSDGTITGTAATGLYDPVTVTVTDRLGNSITTTGLAVRVSD